MDPARRLRAPHRTEVSIERVEVSAYTVPTDLPESDGTLEWDSTTIVVVEVAGGGRRALGYTYADVAAAGLVRNLLAGIVNGRDAMAVPAAWDAMVRAVRNLGRPGVAAMAVAAVDTALWDLITARPVSRAARRNTPRRAPGTPGWLRP